MATTAELRAHPHGRWDLVFLIDGIARGFVSDSDLEVLDSGDGREYVRGLVRKGLVRRMGVDSRNGRLTPLAHTIEIEDHRGDLPALFATDSITVEPLEQNIQPGDDLTLLTDLHDKWIGVEKIGPAGERHQYPVPLGFDIGLQHHTLHEDAEDSENPMTPPPVSDVPVLWAGRRCMLYRVWRDHIGNSTLDAGVIADFDVVTLKNGVGGTTGTADGTDLRGGPRRERRLNGTTDRIDWDNVQQISNVASSGAGWCYFDEVATTLRIIFNTSSAANSFTVIFRRDTTRLDFAIVYTGGGAVNLRRLSDTGQVEAGRWHHVAYTYDGSGLAAGVELYVDGEAVSGYTTSTDGVGTPQVDSGPWSLGGRVNVDTNNLQGRVGNRFRVWDRALGHSEVLAEFQTSYGFRPHSEWEPIWWGTLKDDGRVRARVWSLNCAGVESWLQRNLGSLYQTEPTPVDFELQYVKRSDVAEGDKHEGGIAIRIITENEGANGGAGGGLAGYYANIQWPLDYEFTGGTITEIRDDLNAAIGTAFIIVGADGPWNTTEGCLLDMSTATGTITFAVGEDVAERAQLIIGMHARLWGYLGFDIGLLQADGKYSREGFYAWEATTVHDEAPGDGYVYYKMTLEANEILGDTNLKPALQDTLQPDYSGGVVSLDPNALKGPAGVVMFVDRFGGDTIAHFGQLRTPVASDPADPDEAWPLGGPDIDRSGLWLLSGKRRFADTEEELDTYQVVEASWGDQQGLVRAGRVVVTGLLNPRRFGFDNAQISTPWNAQPGAIVAQPIICLGAKQGSKLDEAHIVMQRLLATTGTSTGWSSYSDDSPVLDAGDNEPTHNGNIVRDSEYADLGLAIPESMMQHASAWASEAEEVGEAIHCKVAITPGQASEDVLHGLMEPLGWAWSLKGGQYGIWCPFHSIAEEQIEVAITRAVIDRGGTGSADMVEPEQSIRQFAPIDRFKIQCSWAPHVEEYLFEAKRGSIDRGVRYRPGGIEESIAAPWWRDTNGGQAVRPIYDRLALKAKFWERRHFVIERLPILPNEARQLWPGTFIRFSHPMPVDPIDGSYGITGRRGVVLSIEESLDPERARHYADILVHADRSAVSKLHAFSARGYGYDTDNDRILVHDNWLAIQGDGTRVDSAFFVEPAYVGLEPFGGDADVKWYQWDGAGWEQTGSGTVTSVGTTPGSCYLEMSGGIASGTYYPCKDTIIVPAAFTVQNAEWVFELYSGIGDEDGVVDGVNLASIWEDVA